MFLRTMAPILWVGAFSFAYADNLVDAAKRHIAAQRFSEALTAIQQHLKGEPRDLPALKLKGDILYLLGDDAGAEKALQAAIAIDSKYLDAQYSLGRIYSQQSRYDSAIKQFQTVLSLDPQSYKAYDNLGICFEHLNQREQAVRHFLKAIEIVHKDVPSYDWPYANLANLLINQGDFKQGFNLAAEAAQRNPNSARNFYLAAKALTRLQQEDKSFRWLYRSIELDPEYPEPHYLLGQLLRKQGKEPEAKLEFKRFKELRDKAPAKLR